MKIKWDYKNIGRHSPWAFLCSTCLVDYVKIARIWLLCHLGPRPRLSIVNRAGEIRSCLSQIKAGLLTACYKSSGPGSLATVYMLCIWDHHIGSWPWGKGNQQTHNYAAVHVVWCAVSNQLFWSNAVSLIVYFWYPIDWCFSLKKM